MNRNQKQNINVGIDMGTGSIAICGRVSQDVIFRKTLLIHHKTASLSDRRAHRRMMRTRVAHKAREYWWNECAAKIGLPLLKTITKTGRDEFETSNVDDRLKREHPPTGDDTCYNGALLRVEILEGRIGQLEDWQIYKAVHAAMRKRGYDPDVPWKTATKKKASKRDADASDNKDDDAATQKNMDEFLAKIDEIGLDKKYQLPCYFDAYQSGLWSPERGVISQRQTHEANQRAVQDFGGYVAPREWHQKELMIILEQVNTRFPGLDPRYVMYGPGLTPYASLPKNRERVIKAGGDQSLKMGRDTDWQGSHGQKLPRFDNRNVNKCRLISRLSVCRMPNLKDDMLPSSDKDDPKQLRLYPKFVFLSKLKNLRVIKAKGSAAEPLSPEEVRAVFDYFSEKLKCTKTELKKYLGTKGYEIAPGHDVDFKFAFGSGRTSYSRPALRLLVKWLYEGWSVSEARTYIDTKIAGNTDPLKGLVKDDFKWLDALAENAWVSSFFVPHTADALQLTPDEVIKSVTFPLVRHRLHLLSKILVELKADLVSKNYDLNKVVFSLEVIRDETDHSFTGEKRRSKMKRTITARQKENKEVTDLCRKYDISGKRAWKAVKLMCRQSFLDPYDLEESIPSTKAELKAKKEHVLAGIKNGIYDLDHVIPESQNGSDGLNNLVVTKRSFNKEKTNRTPFEWLGQDDKRWTAFVRKVNKMKNLANKISNKNKTSKKDDPAANNTSDSETGDENEAKSPTMSKATVKLLLSTEEGEGLSQADLQATAYVEKVAQSLIYSVFGYKHPQLGGKRHVVCVPGAMTARIRRQRKLDGLLYEIKDASNKSEADLKKNRADLNQKLKNRSNPRHHLLDATVLTFISEWALNPSRSRKFRLPDFAQTNWFKTAVPKEHSPEIYNTEKPKIYETKQRLISGGELIGVKKKLADLSVEKINNQLKAGLFNHPPGSTKASPLTRALQEAMKQISDKNNNKTKAEILKNVSIKTGAENDIKIPVKRVYEYSKFSKNNHKVLDSGAVLVSDRHKGAIVYREIKKNGKPRTWTTAVVAAWGSRKKTISRVEAEAAEKGLRVEFWRGGFMLRRGQKIEIIKEADGLAPGILTIRTTKEKGAVGFREKKEIKSINILLTVNQMHLIN